MSRTTYSILCGLALAIAPVGCKPPENSGELGHDHDHAEDIHGQNPDAHDHDEATFSITLWESGHEVFVEHGEVLAGEPVEFVTHLTELQDGTPHVGGSIRFSAAKADGASFEHFESAPAKPGVYLPMLTFPSAGEWELKISVPHAGGAVEIALGEIHVLETSEEPHEHVDDHATDGISLLKEQQWNHGILVNRVVMREMSSFKNLPATVKSVPGAHGRVVAPISGRLSPVTPGVWPRPGRRVDAGEVLFLIQPMFSDQSTRLVEANAAVERARISLEDARKTHDRTEMLVREEARSARDLQAAKKALDLAQNDLRSALAVQSAYESAVLNSGSGESRGADGIPIVGIKAPISGVINEVMPHAAGEFVAEGTELLHTLDATSVFLEARIPESMDWGAGSIASARVRSANSGEWRDVLNTATGDLVAIGQEVDPVSRTFPVIIEASNSDGKFKIGQQLNLQLQDGESIDALAVPLSAVIEEEGLETVYVQAAGETFQKRFVKTGRRDGDWVEVISGVTEGEMVVSQGAYAVRLASVGGDEIPHAHH